MSLTLAYLVITCAICYVVFEFIKWQLGRRRLYKLASKFEGPATLPLIGNGHQFIGNSEHLLASLYKLSTLYPSPGRAWFGPQLLLVISDPDQAKAVCLSSKTLEKSDEVALGRPLVGTGLFTAPVSIWKGRRKLIQPTYNTKILNSYVEMFSAQSKILTDQLEEMLDGGEFEVFYFLSRCTLDMICESAIGVKLGVQVTKNHNYAVTMEKVLDSFTNRIFTFWLRPDFIFNHTKVGRDQRKGCKFLHDFTDNVIEERKTEYLKSKSQQDKAEDDEYDSTPRREAFLDHLLTMYYDGADLSDQGLRDEVITAVVAGSDTVATSMSSLLLMLASHPDIQEKVYRELYEIYGDDHLEERPVAAEDLSRMKYMERAIKETFRLFPASGYFGRKVMDDLDIGDRTLPKGSTVIVASMALHRNEKYWPDPLKFDPDRFLPEETARRHPYAFLPFGAGARNCIGFNYAIMGMKTTCATILRKYVLKKDNIVPVKDIKLKLEGLIRTVDPTKVRIERRNRN